MMRKLAVLMFSLAGLLVLAACGGSSGPGGGGGGITVMPTSATVPLNGTQAFTSTAGAAWSVNGVQGGNSTFGTIDANGLYVAPANEPNPHTVTVTATSGGQSASSTVTIVYPHNNPQSQAIPVKRGTSGGDATDINGNHCCSGTLGALLTRGGVIYILSANHVLAKSDAGTADPVGVTGDPISQPGLIDNNCTPGTTVAHLSEKAALKPATSPGPAPSNVDAAIARIVPGTVDTSGSILDLGAASSSAISPAPPSSTVALPATVLASSEGVAKVGRSTGLTCSTLQSINTTVQVDYAQTCSGATSFTASFSNQLIITGGTFTQAGDSGALLVTSDTARPLGLIYGGNSTTSSANPIQDVLNAFNNGTAPSIVGGADHAVSCQPTFTVQSASASGAQSASLTLEQQQRARDVLERNASSLLRDGAISDVEVGASLDHPGEAALIVTVNGTPRSPIAHQIEGIRTRIVSADGAQAVPALALAEIRNTVATKEAAVNDWMAQPGVLGFGVGRSRDNPAETAIAIYVEAGRFSGAIPPEIGGVRTQVFEGDRFRAGTAGSGGVSCKKPASRAGRVKPQ